ncbi:probable peptidyl-tRNA hydrolase 2 [Tribolium madens]|uniref:probable peptidyl-tRNA hydrolase 2 n=1 Tax=Tribolium madens TaxID=41895 RepID=UPI001CF7396D|nr:probable peptidyl-tRNA hydrolase 2 [Tribolium madens]
MEATNRPYAKFQPNEEYLEALISMGISENHAQEALFCTGNESVEAAVSYVFTNLLHEDNDDENLVPPGAENNVDESPKRYKMTFVVNTALKMGLGKTAAQVAHACLGLYREMRITGDREDALNEWDYFGEKKIILKGENTEHLEALFNKAKEMNVPCYLVSDAGHTQIPPGSVTVLSVFGDEEEVNAITGTLSLL